MNFLLLSLAIEHIGPEKEKGGRGGRGEEPTPPNVHWRVDFNPLSLEMAKAMSI